MATFQGGLCTSEEIVITNAPDGFCPGDCRTLQQYATHPSTSADVTLHLTSENHVLNSNLLASHTNGFTIVATTATITCSSQLVLVNITSLNEIQISGVSFVNCRLTVNSVNTQLTSVSMSDCPRANFKANSVHLNGVSVFRSRSFYFQNVVNFTMEDSQFEQISDTAPVLRINNWNDLSVNAKILITRCTFLDNYITGAYGGALYLEVQTFESRVIKSIIVVTESRFENQTSHNRGAAVYVLTRGNVTTEITSSTFTYCRCNYSHGGAVYIESRYNQISRVAINNNSFINNRAAVERYVGQEGAGAVYITGRALIIEITDSSFTNNTARSGGALSIASPYGSVIIANSSFSNNSAAYDGSGFGGAIFMQEANRIALTNSSFTDNVAEHSGGSVYMQHLNEGLNISSCTFNGSVVRHSGGVLYITLYGRYVLMNNSNFTSSEAGDTGGAVYLNSNANPGTVIVSQCSWIGNRIRQRQGQVNPGENGGSAIIFRTLYTTKVSFIRNTFIDNTATYLTQDTCGAVNILGYTVSYTVLQLTVNFDENMFLRNRGSLGGAICITNASESVTLHGNTFHSNSAQYTGGAVDILATPSLLIEDTHFSSNVANRHGGAVRVNTTSEITIESCSFYDNSAVYGDGGALHKGEHPATINISQSTFSRNSAGDNGGVMFIDGTGNSINAIMSTFSYNGALNRGGVFLTSLSELEITETNFYNNTANLGNSIYACGGTVNVPDEFFVIPDPHIPFCHQYDGYVTVYGAQPTEASTTHPMTQSEGMTTNQIEYPTVPTTTGTSTDAQNYLPVDLPLVSIKGNVGMCPTTGELTHIRQMIRTNIRNILMEVVPQCGDGLWSRVAYLNVSDPSQQCPSAWSEYNSDGVRACRRPAATEASCSGTIFSAGREFTKVCGRVIGYQLRTTDAFTSPWPQVGYRNLTIDESYVDGVSITHGTPRQHIWSFAAGITEQDPTERFYNCPCSNGYAGPMPQTFVGDDYFCESGRNHSAIDGIYPDDKLWDGQQCSNEGTCCTDKSPPWFNVELPNSTEDDIEVRICGDEDTDNEGTPVELLEIYVQ